MPMSREEIDRFLDEPGRLCHFATVDADGAPRVRPLWFLWRDGELWTSTRLKARHTGRDLESSPRVAVSIASEDIPYCAVLLLGHPEVLPAAEDLLGSIAARYEGEAGKAWAKQAVTQTDRVMLRVRPESVLSWNYAREGTDGPSKRTEL